MRNFSGRRNWPPGGYDDETGSDPQSVPQNQPQGNQRASGRWRINYGGALMAAIVRFTLVNRRTRQTVPGWIATVSFADGPGMKVKKMTTTTDRAKAARFDDANAFAIAVQFSQSPASLERPDGTPLVEETARLQAEQKRRQEIYEQSARELRNAFAEIVGDAVRRMEGLR